MHRSGVQNKVNKSRAAAYLACGLFLILADVLFWTRVAWAAPAYTPYANSVAAESGMAAGTSGNAVGAPDGQTANFQGANSSITLDMGDGEEGTNALKVYFGQINLSTQVTVAFLDDNQALISQETRQLFIDLMASTQTFAYDWHSSAKAYRFVRLTSQLGVAFGVDSLEALGFIGSSATQDTDGDGIPDRQDGNPLVVDSTPPSTGGGGGGSTSNGSNTTNTITRTTISTTSGPTPAVNTPPAAASDKDGDQMDDAWELANKLDPNNPRDASEDPDKDKLINLREYQFDTNPRQMDTDGDGMPDGWEVDNGLNAKADDAEQDPDGDYITNLGEYHYGTNPYRADELGALVARLHRGERWWSWTLFALLLALAALCFWRARKLLARAKRRLTKKTASRTRSSLPPL